MYGLEEPNKEEVCRCHGITTLWKIGMMGNIKHRYCRETGDRLYPKNKYCTSYEYMNLQGDK